MNGYIIVAESDNPDISDKYWNGTTFVEDLQEAELVTDKLAARGSAGNLQRSNLELDLKVVTAQKTITFGHVPSDNSEPAGTAV